MKKESERRIATIMFADISGFTAMSEKMDPEEVTMLMNGCFEIMGTIIKHNEGNIDKYIGDCVMVTFGVPTAIENAPQKSINTAIEIRNGIRKFNIDKNLNPALDVHIGINTGTVLSGLVGAQDRQEYTVMGDAVNIASRLEDASVTGQILVGSETWKSTQEAFEYKELKPVSVKGKQEPVPIYELLSTKSKSIRRKITSDRMIHSELVGRDDELIKLELQVLKAVNGEGSIVNVIGEAGIGKSRLIAELKKREVMQRVTVLEGRAISIGRTLSFYPIIELLKQWAGIVEDDSNSHQISKVEQLVERIFPEEKDEVVPFVSTLMGLKLTGLYSERIKGVEGEGLEKLIMKNLREFMRKATANPLVIILDDMHWSDTSSLELLEALCKLVETQKVLFINIFRPGYAETSDKLSEVINESFQNHSVEINLRSLNEKESDTLINNLLDIKGLPHEVRSQILKRAGGNPFFIEEVVRSFIDSGAVVRKDKRFEVTDQIKNVLIPQTINEVLMARIDQLDEKTKNLIKIASVIGRSFFQKILTEVSETTDEIDAKLEYLKGIQLIREHERLNEIEYLFKHALAQETTYESILLKRRRELHAMVAEAIERVFAERLHEFYGTLAYHFSAAENMDKTEEFMEKAGAEAMKASASLEAIKYYKKTIELYTKKYGETVNKEKLGEIEKNLALAFHAKGDFEESEYYFEKAFNNLGITKQGNMVFLVLRIVKNITIILKHVFFPSNKKIKAISNRDMDIIDLKYHRGNALQIIDMIKFLIVSINDAGLLFKYDPSRSQIMFNSFCQLAVPLSAISVKASRKHIANALNLVESSKDRISDYYIKIIETLGNFSIGEPIVQIDYTNIDKALEHGDLFYTSVYLLWSGYYYIETGNSAKFIENIGVFSEVSEKYHDTHSKADIYDLNASMLITRRLTNEAKAHVNALLKLIEELGQETRMIEVLGRRLQIEVIENDFEAAEITKNLVENLVNKIGRFSVVPVLYARYAIGIMIYYLGKLERSTGSEKAAVYQHLKKAAQKNGKIAISTSKYFAFIRTEAYRLMAIYYWIINKQKKSLKWFHKSIKEGERLGARPELSRTYFEVGKRLLDPQSKYKQLNGITSEEYLEKARVLFEEMDLKWDLKQLEKLEVTMNQK